jgi:hypothetical protein
MFVCSSASACERERMFACAGMRARPPVGRLAAGERRPLGEKRLYDSLFLVRDTSTGGFAWCEC